MGPTYLIVGGGISGMSAAWALRQGQPHAQITVLEGARSLGGKIAVASVAGVRLDTGAESVLARRPEALQLIEELGLRQEVVHPATTQAAIWSRGRLHPMPRGTVMGIPGRPSTLSPLLEPDEIARVENEHRDPGAVSGRVEVPQDISVGDFVSDRLGDVVVDRLVEPILGGVYAGHAREISLSAALPALASAYREGTSLLDTARAALPVPAANGTAPPPVFASVRGGLHGIIGALRDQLERSGVTLHTGVMAREVRRRGGQSGAGFEVVSGPRPEPSIWTADRLILATPPAATGRLLREVVPAAGQSLVEIEAASMAIVTLALPVGAAMSLEGSGLLVPPVEGMRVKAATFSGNKWEWIGQAGRAQSDDVVMLRASLGRHREAADLHREDSELVLAVRRDLETMLGQSMPAPIDAHVQRWGGALPQYAVGHVERVASIKHAVAQVSGLAVCGATYEGVGIPACIASARSAAAQVLHAQWVHDHP